MFCPIGSDARRTDRRRTVATHRTFAAEASATESLICRTQTDAGASNADGHRIRAALRHRLEFAFARERLWLRDGLLAAAICATTPLGDVLEMDLLGALAHRLIRHVILVIEAQPSVPATLRARNAQTARYQRHFDLRPRHLCRARRERMAQIDHRIQPTTEEVIDHCGVLKLPIIDSDRYAFRDSDGSGTTRIPLLPGAAGNLYGRLRTWHQLRDCSEQFSRRWPDRSSTHTHTQLQSSHRFRQMARDKQRPRGLRTNGFQDHIFVDPNGVPISAGAAGANRRRRHPNAAAYRAIPTIRGVRSRPRRNPTVSVPAVATAPVRIADNPQAASNPNSRSTTLNMAAF